jgi:hypothetical protein
MLEKRPLKLSQSKFFILLLSLLSLILAYPFFTSSITGLVILDIIFSVILLVAIYAISGRKTIFIVSLILVSPVLAARWLTYFIDSPSTILAGNIIALPLFILITSTILIDVFRGNKVTTDKICGAICAYLLIGITWAFIFIVIERFQPGSFLFGEVDLGVAGRQFSHFMYYSFVTLTTLGYGDITPVSSISRTYSSIEAITGQFYMAVMIARLVGMHIVTSHNKE